jgi:Flp pilus assembly protein TadB
VTALAVLAAVVAAGIVVAPRPALSKRLADLGSPGAPVREPPQQSRSPLRIALAAGALIVSVAAIGGSGGIVTGVIAAVLITVAPARHQPRRVAADEIPVVVDLLAGCLDAGAGIADALDAAAIAASGLLHDLCRDTASALRNGAPAASAWQLWLSDPSLAAVGRTAVRTARTGASAAEDFRRTASRLRARRQAAAQHRVRQASVWLVVPLGLCFLPAFVLVAVAPLVIGLLPTLRL